MTRDRHAEYLLANRPRPTSGRAQQADLTDIVRLYGQRNWVEQGYKQVKGELGLADFQVRSDRAIRRHWTLVCCAFSFCWQAYLAEQLTAPESQVAAPSAAPSRPATVVNNLPIEGSGGLTGSAGSRPLSAWHDRLHGRTATNPFPS
jgi:hypothetical protein